jgi:hypothetical protein
LLYWQGAAHAAVDTGTNALALLALLEQKRLLYWHKRSSTRGCRHRYKSALALLVQTYLLSWQKSTCFPGTKALALLAQKHLLYWHKRTCFTGTKVQILTQVVVSTQLAEAAGQYAPASTCFTGTKVQILTQVVVSTQLAEAAGQYAPASNSTVAKYLFDPSVALEPYILEGVRTLV